MVSINFEGAKQFYARQPDAAAAQAAFDTLVNGIKLLCAFKIDAYHIDRSFSKLMQYHLFL